MALKAKVANKVQTNSNGLVEGIITKVLEIDEHTEIEKGKEINYRAQFEFQIEAQGSQKPITYRIWTGQKIDNEKYKKTSDAPFDYTDLPKLLIQLEVINESELIADLEKFNGFDVESVQGLKIQFELEDSRKNKNLKVPKLASIKPLKVK